jgi:thiamine biosynthesis lipoprotein
MQYLYKFEAMTTPCEVLLFYDDKRKADETAQAVLKEAKQLEKKYNYFAEDSYLSALNRRERDDLDAETYNLLQRATQYYRLTEHVFDITLATIKDLYRSKNSLEALHEAKAKLMLFVGCEHFQIKKGRLSFDNPYTKIDLGGFVKEYAVDRAVRIIQKANIASALVNFGGDIYALGSKPDGQKFRIGIKDPKNPRQFIQFEEIENEALTTSASYERYMTIEGETHSHILSKTSVKNSPASVTVISGNCVESGVWSTALMVKPDLQTKNRAIILK